MYRTSPKYRRLEHLLKGDVPTQTEIRSYLGSSLAQIFNEHSNEATKKLLGVEPPLKGPEVRELWISPSDRLVGKVALKPPLTNKYVKACTHRGILEIGEYAVWNFEMQTEKKIREELDKETVEKRKMFEAEKRHAVNMSVNKVREEYENIMAHMTKKFKQELKVQEYFEKIIFAEALDDAEAKSKKEVQKAIIQQRLDLELEMVKKLRKELDRVIDSLNEEFELAFIAERLNMIADFNAIMRKECKKVEVRMKALEDKSIRDMCMQRREFEAEKIADNSLILCNERMRCISETQAMRQCYEKKIEALQKLLLEKKEQDRGFQVEQKSTENEGEKGIFRVIEIIDKNGNSWRPMLLEPEAVQIDCIEEEPLQSIVESKVNFFPPDIYTDRVPTKALSFSSSVASRDSLPFIYYENRLYIRSDYREKNAEAEQPMEQPKTMAELAEGGGQFIMELKQLKSSC